MRACRNTGGNMWCTYNIHRHGNIFGHICCWWVSVWSLRVCRVWMGAAGHGIHIYKVRSLVVQWGSDKQRRQTGCFCVCEGVQIAVYNKPFGRGAYSSMQTMYGVFLNIQWFLITEIMLAEQPSQWIPQIQCIVLMTINELCVFCSIQPNVELNEWI